MRSRQFFFVLSFFLLIRSLASAASHYADLVDNKFAENIADTIAHVQTPVPDQFLPLISAIASDSSLIIALSSGQIAQSSMLAWRHNNGVADLVAADVLNIGVDKWAAISALRGWSAPTDEGKRQFVGGSILFRLIENQAVPHAISLAATHQISIPLSLGEDESYDAGVHQWITDNTVDLPFLSAQGGVHGILSLDQRLNDKMALNAGIVQQYVSSRAVVQVGPYYTKATSLGGGSKITLNSFGMAALILHGKEETTSDESNPGVFQFGNAEGSWEGRITEQPSAQARSQFRVERIHFLRAELGFGRTVHLGLPHVRTLRNPSRLETDVVFQRPDRALGEWLRQGNLRSIFEEAVHQF